MTTATLPAKTFTRDEATRALPYVSRVAADIVAAYAVAVEMKSAGCTIGEKPDYERQIDRLDSLISELAGVGVTVVDYHYGTVHFPAPDGGVWRWSVGEAKVGE